jgi:regulatory protein
VGKITAIIAKKGRGKRVNVFLENKVTLSLETEMAVQKGLKVGQELSDKKIGELTDADELRRCLNAATYFLTYRPRSESELTEKLNQRGFNDYSVAAVIKKLKKQGLVDDRAFAQYWKASRQSLNLRSRWLTTLELKRKGVAEEIIDEVGDTINDMENAYRVAIEKTNRLHVADYQNFYQRLSGYLRRRGYNYEVIKQTINRIYKEQDANLNSSSSDV